MRIAEHVLKFQRLDQSRSKFDPVADFELWFWMSLSAGTTIINAALHAAEITEENDYFPTQVADVYARAADRGNLEYKIVFNSDLMHVGLPPLSAPLPPALAEAFDAMETIEGYRDRFVRGEESPTHEVVTACDTAYRKVETITQGIVQAAEHRA